MRAQRLRADLASCTRAVAASGPRAAVDSDRMLRIGEHLDHADDVLDQYFERSWPMRLFAAGHAYQEALASVYRASEDLILVQSDEAVAARLPGLRAAVRSYLSADDPRREIYLLRIDAALTTIGAERLAEAARLAARMSEQRTEEVDDVADPGG